MAANKEYLTSRKTFKSFRERWIPLEERYFSAYSIPERAELTIQPQD